MGISLVEPIQAFASGNGIIPQRTQIWRVVSDDIYEDPMDILAAANGGDRDLRKPWVWGSKNDQGLFSDSFDVRLEDPPRGGQGGGNRFQWIVTLVYVDYRHNANQQASPRRNVDNLTAQSPAIDFEDVRWSGSYFQYEELTQLTENDEAFTNSAEQPYAPESVIRCIDTIEVEFMTESLNLNDRKLWVNSVNSSPIWGFDAWELALMKWQFKLLYNQDNECYIRNLVELWVQDGGWKVDKPDYGTHQLEDGSAATPHERYEVITAEDPEDVLLPTGNVMLDGSGFFQTDQTTVTKRSGFEFHKTTVFTSTPLGDLEFPVCLSASAGEDPPLPPPEQPPQDEPQSQFARVGRTTSTVRDVWQRTRPKGLL